MLPASALPVSLNPSPGMRRSLLRSGTRPTIVNLPARARSQTSVATPVPTFRNVTWTVPAAVSVYIEPTSEG